MGAETYPSPDFGKTLHRGILNIDEYHRIDEEGEETFPGSKLVNDGNRRSTRSRDRSTPRRHGSTRTPRGSTP